MAYLKMLQRRQCGTRKNGFPQYMIIMLLFLMGSMYGPLFGMLEEEQAWGSEEYSSSYSIQPKLGRVSNTKPNGNKHVSTTNCVRLKRAYNNVMKIYMQELPSHVVKRIEALNEATCQNESIESLDEINPTNQATKYSINILSAMVAVELSIFLVALPSEHFGGLEKFLPKNYCDYYKIWSTIPLLFCTIYFITLWLIEQFLSPQSPPWWISVFCADGIALISIAFLWKICKNKKQPTNSSSSEHTYQEEKTNKCPRDIQDTERILLHKPALHCDENDWATRNVKVKLHDKSHTCKEEQVFFKPKKKNETDILETRDREIYARSEVSLLQLETFGKEAEEKTKVVSDTTNPNTVDSSGGKQSQVPNEMTDDNEEKELQTKSLSTDTEEFSGKITEAIRKPLQNPAQLVEVKHLTQGRVEHEPTIVVPEEEIDDLELWRQSFARSVTEDLDVKFNRVLHSVAASSELHLYQGNGPEYERKCRDHYTVLKPIIHGIAHTCMQMWQDHGNAFKLEEARALILQVAGKWLSVVGSYIAKGENGVIEPNNGDTSISMTEDDKAWFKRAMTFEQSLNISVLEGGPDNSLLYDKWMMVGKSYGPIGEETMQSLLQQII